MVLVAEEEKIKYDNNGNVMVYRLELIERQQEDLREDVKDIRDAVTTLSTLIEDCADHKVMARVSHLNCKTLSERMSRVESTIDKVVIGVVVGITIAVGTAILGYIL